MDFFKRHLIIFLVSIGLSAGLNFNTQATGCDQNGEQLLKKLMDTQSVSKRAAWIAKKEMVKFGGTALLLIVCKKLGNLHLDGRSTIDDVKIFEICKDLGRFLVLILAIGCPTISEMFFLGKDPLLLKRDSIDLYIANLSHAQKIQFVEEIKKSIQKDFIITTLIDSVVLPLLFYFCLFKDSSNRSNNDSQKKFAIMCGLISALGQSIINWGRVC